MTTEKISPTAIARMRESVKGKRLHYLVTYPPGVGQMQRPYALVRVFVAYGDSINEITTAVSNVTGMKWVNRAYGDGIKSSSGNVCPAAHLHHNLAMSLGLDAYGDMSFTRL